MVLQWAGLTRMSKLEWNRVKCFGTGCLSTCLSHLAVSLSGSSVVSQITGMLSVPVWDQHPPQSRAGTELLQHQTHFALELPGRSWSPDLWLWEQAVIWGWACPWGLVLAGWSGEGGCGVFGMFVGVKAIAAVSLGDAGSWGCWAWQGWHLGSCSPTPDTAKAFLSGINDWNAPGAELFLHTA